MNLGEFKAWFEGFTENMKQPPSAKAWARIKERVGEITEKPTEIRWVYGSGYYPHYYYQTNTLTIPCTTGYSSAPDLIAAGQNVVSTLTVGGDVSVNSCFTALGKADALLLSS